MDTYTYDTPGNTSRQGPPSQPPPTTFTYDTGSSTPTPLVGIATFPWNMTYDPAPRESGDDEPIIVEVLAKNQPVAQAE